MTPARNFVATTAALGTLLAGLGGIAASTAAAAPDPAALDLLVLGDSYSAGNGGDGQIVGPSGATATARIGPISTPRACGQAGTS